MNASRRGIGTDASDTTTKQVSDLRALRAGRGAGGRPAPRAAARAHQGGQVTFFGKEGDQSQREASPFTQFALTGCALLLVGLGLLQIFGTMVTVKARDETKKKQ